MKIARAFPVRSISKVLLALGIMGLVAGALVENWSPWARLATSALTLLGIGGIMCAYALDKQSSPVQRVADVQDRRTHDDAVSQPTRSPPLAAKLQLAVGIKVALVGAPADVGARLARESADVIGDPEGSGAVLAFVTTRAESDEVATRFHSGRVVANPFWVAYPKEPSSEEGRISRDELWESFKVAGWTPMRQDVLDDAWAVMRFQRVEQAG